MYISKWHQTEQESERGAQALHTRTWCVKWDAKSSGRIDFASWSTGKRCDASLIAFACSVAPSIYRSFSLAQLEHPHQIDSFSPVRFWATHTQILHAVTKPQAKPYSRANGCFLLAVVSSMGYTSQQIESFHCPQRYSRVLLAEIVDASWR